MHPEVVEEGEQEESELEKIRKKLDEEANA